VDQLAASSLKEKFALLMPKLNERGRRMVAAAEARALGRGGIALVARISGVAYATISRGLKELATKKKGDILDPSRVRRHGGGRKSLHQKEPRLIKDLESLVEPATRGDPMRALRWTSKSLRTLAEQLHDKGHTICHPVVGKLLRQSGYSLQSNRKIREGKKNHPDRNAQFEYLSRQVAKYQRAGNPVISVDTKKKELVGDFKNAGQEWRPQGQPRHVRVHDFKIPRKGKVAPYGVYDLTTNKGWVSIGISHDTSAFAVNSIRRWWRTMGRRRYPRSKSLLITADSGGSNGWRVRLWKLELQKLADQIGQSISVCHFPPGTSKWNKIEHRLFSFISKNWRGRPLESLAVIVSLIAATRTKNGLTVRCVIDTGHYPKGQKISDEEMTKLRIEPAKFHGEWNYTIHPR
jgi:hypothetical protein